MAEKQARNGKPNAGNPLQVILWAVTLAAQAFAGSVTTTHRFVADDGSFHDAANWNPAEVPSSGTAAINAIVTNGTVRISQDATLWTLGIGTRGCANGIQTGGVLTLRASGSPDSAFSLGGYQDGVGNAVIPMVGTYTLAGGVLRTPSGYLHVGQRAGDYASEGILHVTGGAVTCATWTAIGRFTDGRGHALVEGTGSFTVTGNGLNVGEDGLGLLTVRNGGAVTVNAPVTLASGGANSAGRIRLGDGGRLTAGQIKTGGKGKQNGLAVDGGTLSPDCYDLANSATKQASWIAGLAGFNVGTKGVTFDTAGRTVRVPQTVTVAETPERLATSNLVHRWSFNGDLADSVGKQTATLAGTNADSSHMDFDSCTIHGGAKGVRYISLGSDILPKDGRGATLEIWATQLAAKSYSRVFEIGENSSWTMSMAWSTGVNINQDRIGISHGSWDANTEYALYDVAKTAPYTIGVQYHIAWVFNPPAADGDGWTITVYKHDAVTGALLARHDYTPPAGWTLPAARQNNCWLGHSTYGDNDAAAAYDEVRVWNKPLTEEELAASVRLGPDTDFAAAPGAIVKTGSGRLELPSVVGARDVVVREGTLAAGTGGVALTHRWTFNGGDLQDKVGTKNAWIVQPTDAGKEIATSATSVTLPGGARGKSGHIELGKDILPSDGSPLTIELWATQHGIESWSRIFEIGSNWTNTMLMAWTRNDNINQNRLEGTDGMNGDTYRMVYRLDDSLAPYTLDTEYHIAVTMAPDAESGRWRVTAYKQDAATGETLNKATTLAAEGWSPARLVQEHAYLGYSISNDHDAHASYNEVRVWAVALTEEQLTKNAQLGPDVVRHYPAGEATASSLPASSRVDVRAGASLDLCGGTTTAASLTGEGTVMNGTFAATEGILPGDGGASGALKLADGAALGGTLVVAPAADGMCGALAAEGALDLSGLDLTVAAGSAFKGGVSYTLATCAPGRLAGTFRSVPAQLEGAIRYDAAAGQVTCKVGGVCIIIR